LGSIALGIHFVY